MAPVMTLKQLGVDAMVAGGMGGRPLAGFQQVGIAVHFKEESTTVREAVELFAAGKCRSVGEAQTCGGGGGHCGGHGHHEVEREPIEGTADVRDGRVVTLEYAVKDADGTVLDSSGQDGPMLYLQGSGAIAGLEKGLAGLEVGAEATIGVAAKDGFCERDESKVLELPRGQIPPDAQVGTMLAAQDGSGRPIALVVLELRDDVARLDANHPCAGQDLTFEVKVTRVEKATADEIEHGHVH